MRTAQLGLRWVIAMAAMSATARVVSAQTAAAPPPLPAFVVQSRDSGNLLQFDVLAHVDGRFAPDRSAASVIDTFTMRRFRPIAQGRILRRVEFLFTPDFGGGTVVVQDAYVDTVFAKAFRLRVGKFKTPVGLERLASANSLVFVERSLVTWLVPNRNVGVQVLGDIAGNTFSYMAAVVRSGGAGANADGDDNGEVAWRLMARPLARRQASVFSGLGLGVAGSTGMVAQLPVVRTPTMFAPFLSYAGATAEGDLVRIAPQAFYYFKSFSAFGEYVHTAQSIRRGDVSADIDHRAWNVTASYVLTGEKATERALRPHHNFTVRGGSIGAVQIAARYHALSVDQEAITRGLASPESNRRAQAFTAGVNWYLNPYMKYVVNVERTVFDGNSDGPRPVEHALVIRAQFFF